MQYLNTDVDGLHHRRTIFANRSRQKFTTELAQKLATKIQKFAFQHNVIEV